VNKVLTPLYDDSPPKERAAQAYEALQSLPYDERARLEDLLLNRFYVTKDSHIAIALGLMKSQRAAAYLRARLDGATGQDGVRIALALYRINGFPEAVERIIEVLHSNLPQWERREALEALTSFGLTPTIVSALLETLEHDRDRSISGWAGDVLCYLFEPHEVVRDLIQEIRIGKIWQRPSASALRELRAAIESAMR
jgi:HEAT repeat protein